MGEKLGGREREREREDSFIYAPWAIGTEGIGYQCCMLYVLLLIIG